MERLIQNHKGECQWVHWESYTKWWTISYEKPMSHALSYRRAHCHYYWDLVPMLKESPTIHNDVKIHASKMTFNSEVHFCLISSPFHLQIFFRSLVIHTCIFTFVWCIAILEYFLGLWYFSVLLRTTLSLCRGRACTNVFFISCYFFINGILIIMNQVLKTWMRL